MKEKLRLALKIIGLIFLGVFLLVGLISPIVLIVFYSYVAEFEAALIITLILIMFAVGIFGTVLFVKQIKEMVKTKRENSDAMAVRTHRVNKIVPFVVLGLIFGIYVSIYPQWYYELGVPAKFGPYISLHGENGMQISWDSKTDTQSYVEYGTSKDNLDKVAWGGEYYWQGVEKPVSKHHCVLLENLEPATVYYYRIPLVSSEIYSFVSKPAVVNGGAVLFTIQGDTQGNYNIQKQNIARMKESTQGFGYWNFTIIAGDLSNKDDRISEWAMVFDSKSYGGIATSIPWQACSGNHEGSSTNKDHPPRQNFKKYFQNAFASNWKNPDGNWDIGTYYSFNYSNVHIAMVDSYENKNHSISQRQLEWLSADLTNAKNAGLWTIVVFHTSMYSTSGHGSYPELADKIEPLMKSCRIDAIFYGHDHIFEAYNVFTNESYGGTHCFMVAGGGGSLKKVENPDTMGDRVWTGVTNEKGNYYNNVSEAPDNRFDVVRGHEWQLYGEKTFHYMQVKIEGDTGYFAAFRTADGSLIMNYTLTRNL